tara:strand:- start:1386 stop:3203 length:1818 start_codon:yes stop_codon:yes gene_type:complete
MAVMLENQAAQLLRESNTLGGGTSGAIAGSAGNIAGFQNVAFPIVRRVFGGLVANDLVSIQPMSLPSGLLFYLDYTYGTSQGGADNETTETATASAYTAGESIYNNPSGKGIQSGSLGRGGQYDLLGSGYSRVHEEQAHTLISAALPTAATHCSILTVNADTGAASAATVNGSTVVSGGASSLTGAVGRLVDFDSALAQYLSDNSSSVLVFCCVGVDYLDGDGTGRSFDLTMLQDMVIYENANSDFVDLSAAGLQSGTGILNLRRHNKRVSIAGDVSGGKVTVDPLGGDYILLPCIIATTQTPTAGNMNLSAPMMATLDVDDTVGSALTIPSFEHDGSSGTESPVIPEIDIKIESLAVTAVSRKLKAKWSPELAQDLNAYHSLDAEVELTQILSEQIALELDREILNDLLSQANGANLYWSRAPGKFVNKLTGVEVPRNTSLRPGPQFTGTVRDWYETLIETIIDAGNIIHRKTLRGSANFMVVGPDVATILEASVAYKPSYTLDGEGQASAISIGAEKVGTLSNRFTVYKDPYFPRNRILVGYKGGSYLETGYVYAPYVPLIVTPTIFAPEDFTPRKGVMTRYGKKMVRSDFYGTVTCMDMNII